MRFQRFLIISINIINQTRRSINWFFAPTFIYTSDINKVLLHFPPDVPVGNCFSTDLSIIAYIYSWFKVCRWHLGNELFPRNCNCLPFLFFEVQNVLCVRTFAFENALSVCASCALYALLLIDPFDITYNPSICVYCMCIHRTSPQRLLWKHIRNRISIDWIIIQPIYVYNIYLNLFIRPKRGILNATSNILWYIISS